MTKIGIGFLCFGLLLLGGWWFYLSTRRCQPVHMPLATFVGDVRTSDFTVNVRNLYIIELEAQKTIPFEQLNCLLGLKEPAPQDCSKAPSVVNVEWTLFSDGNIVQRGSSADTPYGGWANDRISRDLGDFHGSPGHRYQIAFRFVTDATQLSVTNPYLNVSVNPAFTEGMLFMTGLVVYPTTGVLLLTSILLVLLSFFRARASREGAELHAGVQ